MKKQKKYISPSVTLNYIIFENDVLTSSGQPKGIEDFGIGVEWKWGE